MRRYPWSSDSSKIAQHARFWPAPEKFSTKLEKCSRGRAANRARGRLRKCCRSVAGRAEKRSRSHRRAPLTEKRLRNDVRRCVARSAIIPPHRWISRIAPGRRIASWRIAAVVVIAEVVLIFRSVLRIAVGVRESFGPHLASLATNCFVLAANVVRASVFCARLAANEVRADVRQKLSFVEVLRQLPEPLCFENVVLRRNDAHW